MSLKKKMMKTNNYHREGIKQNWKINVINIATMLILLAMMMSIGQCVDNGVTNDDDITDSS